jgi:hypothetical protein
MALLYSGCVIRCQPVAQPTPEQQASEKRVALITGVRAVTGPHLLLPNLRVSKLASDIDERNAPRSALPPESI